MHNMRNRRIYLIYIFVFSDPEMFSVVNFAEKRGKYLRFTFVMHREVYYFYDFTKFVFAHATTGKTLCRTILLIKLNICCFSQSETWKG